MLKNILDRLTANQELFSETAFIVTFDEGGGYWDSASFSRLISLETVLEFHL